MRLNEIENTNWSDYKLVTSNENKLKEFSRFGLKLDIEKGRDLPEVQGTDVEVIKHKALDAGEKRIVEDTSLNIEGADVGVNVKWLLNDLENYIGMSAEWVVLLGANTGNQIRIYKGNIKGTITESTHDNAFGFDGIFNVDKVNRTLAELEEMNMKDDYSARLIAIQNLASDNPYVVYNINEIEKWQGEYQK